MLYERFWISSQGTLGPKPGFPSESPMGLVVVQSISYVQLFVTPTNCSMPGFPVLHYLPEFAQTHIHWVSDTIQPFHPLLPPFPLASILPIIKVLFNQALYIRWPKYHSFSINPSNEYSGLISFRIDWLVWFPYCSRDSQKSSLAPWFKNISSSVLSLLYGSTLTSVHGYWKNHSFDCTDLCWLNNVSAF